LKIPKISKKWVPLIKSLTILDLLLENDLQIEAISEIPLDSLIKFQTIKLKKEPYDYLIKSFGCYLKEKSKIYLFQAIRLSFYVSRNISTQNSNPLTVNISLFQPLHDLIYEIIEICEQGLLKYPLIQNLFEGFLVILHGFYQLQLDTFKDFSLKFFSFDLLTAQNVRNNCAVFIKNTQALISFINKHQFMKFLQMKNPEIELFQPKLQLLQSFDDFIMVLMRKQEFSGKFEKSRIESEGQIDQNIDCDIIDSDRDHEIQRKQDILISPIKAHFIKKPEKPWSHNNNMNNNSPRNSLPITPLQSPDKLKDSISNRNGKFKFCEKNELFCQEIFEKFENQYSQTYRGSMIELDEYEGTNFDLQIKFNAMGKMLFRRQTVELNENVEFSNIRPFKDATFKDYRNFFSKDFEKKTLFNLKDETLQRNSNAERKSEKISNIEKKT